MYSFSLKGLSAGFLGFCNVYAMRVNLSVAIVAMVNSSANSNINSSSSNRKQDRISMLISFRGFFTLGTTNVRNI